MQLLYMHVYIPGPSLWCGSIMYCLYIDIRIIFNSYCAHEEEIDELAKEMGFFHVSLSSKVMPMVKMVPRGYTGIYIMLACACSFKQQVSTFLFFYKHTCASWSI